MHISDDVKSTSPNRLNGTDMTGIGVTSSRARFGLAAFSERLVSAKRMNSWQFRRWRDMPLIQHQKRAKAAGKALALLPDAGAVCLCGVLTFGGHQRNVSQLREPALFPAMKM
jgi:hypothetical protein